MEKFIEHRLNTIAETTTIDKIDLPLNKVLTVAAWVHSDTSRAEAMQPLVSQWTPRSAFDTFTAYDAGHTDQLSTRGYFGAVFDGRYVYFCPVRDQQDRTAVHGRVLRYDTQAEFKDPDNWQAFDASYTDGLHTAGFYGGAFDGRYVYFNPRDDGHDHHSRLLRYDTQAEFKDPDSWQAHDVQFPHSGQGLAFDGQYLYFCPGYTKAPHANPANPAASLDDEPSGQILRYNTRAPLKDPASYTIFDAQQVSEQATCFDGAVFDGRHIYFAPLSGGQVLRYNIGSEFSDPASWDTYNASPQGMLMNVGVLFDGRHIYFCSYGNSHMLRYDTDGDFGHPDSWEKHDAAQTNSLDTGGFDGGFFDGRYLYYMPFTRNAAPGESIFHCNWLRYDTTGIFTDPASWSAHDASFVDGLHTTAYNAGAFDGRFFYTAPWRGDLDNGEAHGRVLRYDTLGSASSFSLRYDDFGHNGGLCAALLGPSFTVNTTHGAVSIATYQTLAPGTHHLVGVYDDKSIKLYIDGTLAAERLHNGHSLQQSNTAVDIGHIAQGTARFQGTIAKIYLANTAQDATWIDSAYRADTE